MTTDRTRTYVTWRDMHRRCYNPKNRSYHNYGGRGITICERWKNNFENFLTDMGFRPIKFTIERVDVNQGYDPFNCVWATKADNNRNTRKNIAAKQRLIDNPPMEPWEKQYIRQASKPAKPIYIPQSPVHGSKKMYLKHGCRCETCVSAMRVRRGRIRKNQSEETRQKKIEYLKNYRAKKRNS